MRSLQALRLTHCTLASSSGLAYVAFLSQLTSLECGLRVPSAEAWGQQGLDPWLVHLCKLKQVREGGLGPGARIMGLAGRPLWGLIATTVRHDVGSLSTCQRWVNRC